MTKELAEAKLEVGRAKKVLWEYRNKDIEEFEYINAIAYLEECVAKSKLQALKEEVDALYGDAMAPAQSAEAGYNKALDEVLNLITNLEDK